MNEFIRYIDQRLDERRVDFWLSTARKLTEQDSRLSLYLVTDHNFPRNLRESYDCPPLIWVRGELSPEDNSSISIIGSRRASRDSLDFSYEAASAVAKSGFCVISGLARGIDTAAHRAAIDLSARTVGVLGFGIGYPLYPPENAVLAEKILDNGVLLTYFPPSSPPTPSSFVARNSVISALSKVSLLVDGEEKSGSRTEVEFALQQGRRVLFWRAAAEKHSWIRLFAMQENVGIVESSDDVVDELRRAYV
ncbi:DNA-processing protein DprA [Amycolatopsis sp. NPDC049691]|uniref:DNA-processing protein DprA n=1 Tax=Amycolatopsis sp. NPDC049691 TaxID=3155155 RepID=UPI00342FC7E8